MSSKSPIFALFMLLAVLISACGASTTSTTPKYNLLGTQGSANFVVVDKGLNSDRSGLKSIADTICKGETICIVMFWDDNSKAASSLPMTDAQVNAKIAHYNLNKNTGMDRLLICASDGC